MADCGSLGKDAGVVILGAGPTGLGVALGVVRSGSSTRTLLVEKREAPGGLAGSFRWKGHRVDFGPHRLSPHLQSVNRFALKMLGPDRLVKKNQQGVQYQGKLYQFPPRLADWIDPRAALPLIAFFVSYLWAQLSSAAWRFEGNTFERIMIRRFGARFFRRVAAPMAEKVWGRVEDIDPAFADQRFSVIEPAQVLKRLILRRQELNPAVFHYPRLGFQQLWERTASYLLERGQGLIYRSHPQRLEVDAGRIRRIVLSTPDGPVSLERDDLTIVSTIPVANLIGCLHGFPVDGLKAKLARARVLSMLLVSFEFAQERVLPYRIVTFPEREFIFNRLFEQGQFSPDTVERGRSVVTADITLPRGARLWQTSDPEVVDRVRGDLARLPFMSLARCLDARVERIEFAYAPPDLESRRILFEIHHELKQISNLELMGRFSTGEYHSSDYALEAGLLLGQMLSGRLSRPEYLRQVQGRRERAIVD